MIVLAAWWFNSHLPLVVSEAIQQKNGLLEIRITKIETFLKITSKDAATVIGQIPNLLKDAGNNQIKLQAVLELTAEAAQQAQHDSEGKQQQVSPEQLSNAGISTIAALPKLIRQQPAVDAITALAAYRSFQNAPFAPSSINSSPVTTGKGNWNWNFDLPLHAWEHPVGQVEMSAARPDVPASDAARAESLARSDFNRGNQTGFSFLFVRATKEPVFVHLDGWYVKNTVIRGATIVYDGGPVRLVNVTFVNCSFQFNTSPEALKLAQAIIEKPSVTL